MNNAYKEVRVVMHEPVLQAIFDECDLHDYAETGGRLVGTYRTEPESHIELTVSGMIEPGPEAKRTPTSFFQDGKHQERVFRHLELELPELEHLGNWHSHHVNGYPTLSEGDKVTYHRIVNHPKHNTDFFYAILVVKKNPRRCRSRYSVKHFVLFRNQSGETELSPSQVQIVSRPIIWPQCANAEESIRVHSNRDMLYKGMRYGASVKGGFVGFEPVISDTLEKDTGDDLGDVIGRSYTGHLVSEAQRVSMHRAGIIPRTKYPSFGEIHAWEQDSSTGASASPLHSRLNQVRSPRRSDSTVPQTSELKVPLVSSMSVVTLYVGQGALAVVRNFDEVIVVDSHLPPADNGARKRTERILDRLLGGYHAVGFVLTGFDADHSSPDGVELILSKYNPRWIMYPKYYKDTDTASEVFRIIERHERDRRLTCRPLRRLSVRVDTVGSRFLQGLSDRFNFELFSPHFADMDNSNNSSIVLKISGNSESAFSYLVTGDTENDRWDHINRIFDTNLVSDMLAAPHHGSKNAVHPGALLSINPDTVLISAGVDNQYGHPDPQAVDVYQRIARHVYSTNVEGGVSLYTNRKRSGIQTQLAR